MTGSESSGTRKYWWLVLAALALVAYELGQIRAGYNRLASASREQVLRSELDEAVREQNSLRERIAVLDTDQKVKAEAYRLVEDQMVGLQSQITKLEEDLAFYQGIVSADQQTGLRIQDLAVSGGAEQTWIVRLVLAQALRSDRRISGRVDLAIEGMRDGEAVTLKMKDLQPASGAGSKKIEYSFKYFQNLETNVVLPENFTPASVTVKLTPKSKSDKVVERTFQWPVQAG